MRRFQLFLDLIKPRSGDTLLDVGGAPGYWTRHRQIVARIDSLNIREASFDASKFPNHSIRTLVGDGCALGFPDKSYDIAHSNSVIEHVGSWERQREFAQELRRVGKSIWCQTPARECPIEPHYLAPFVHWLPKSLQRKVIRWCTVWGLLARPSKGQIDEMVETTRLISQDEMRALFPDCEIRVEYLLPFIPKSYIAIRRWTPSVEDTL